jgi:glutathione S-transferase
MTWRLYGTPGSLYTAKARSYLIKQGIEFENRAAGEERFRAEIAPTVGRWIIPVLEHPSGTLIQDGSEIIAHFEDDGGARESAYPPTPLHRLIGQIFELFGGEGLLRPAMHFRWNFDAINGPFLAQDFPAALAPPGAPATAKAQVFAMSSARMRKAMAGFGVSSETIPAIEASYADFLRLFDEHLETSPYLLGGRPTIGDYGLIGPLYAHLARDPYPSQLMKQRAFRVWRWVERMNAKDQDAGEYGAPPAQLFPNDSVPESLKQLLRFVAEDYLPEIQAFVEFTNAWLAERPDIEAGSNGMPRPQDRVIGQTTFTWRGLALRVNVLPYRIYLLQKVQAVIDGADPTERRAIDAFLEETGLSALSNLRTTRRVERQGYLEVWGASAP